ncbi:MAG: hypothetical protein Alpg2KO_00020 [Alphaproteobacteria bacterium]
MVTEWVVPTDRKFWGGAVGLGDALAVSESPLPAPPVADTTPDIVSDVLSNSPLTSDPVC